MQNEDDIIFRLSRRIDLILGVTSTVFTIGGIFMYVYIDSDAGNLRAIVIMAGGSICSIYFLLGYFLVHTIILTNNRIVFRPCGHEILLSDIDAVKNASDFRSEADAECPGRIEFITNVNRLKWTPANTIWIGEAILIRTYGFSAARFVKELELKLNKYR